MIPKFRAFHNGEMTDIFKINFSTNEIVYANELGIYHKIDERVLMQSTGLKDKNDIEIFEGDVVLWNDWKKVVVSFGSQTVEENFGDIRIFQGFNLYLGGGYPEPVMSTFEVIGNIHENPEILEVNS